MPAAVSPSPPTLRTTPLGAFGLHVERDLSKPLSAEEGAELRALIDDQYLLLFRGQRLSMEEQAAVLAHLGPIPDGNMGRSYVKPTEGQLGAQELAFHSDISFVPHPIEFLSLHATDVEDDVHTTSFVDLADAWRRLPDGLREQVSGKGLTSVDFWAPKPIGYDIPDHTVRCTRPTPFPHPRTGRPLLYASVGVLARVEEVARDESDRLREALFAHVADPGHVWTHVWRTGDLLIWDNVALAHARPPLRVDARRTLQRVAVTHKTMFEQMPSGWTMPAAKGGY